MLEWVTVQLFLHKAEGYFSTRGHKGTSSPRTESDTSPILLIFRHHFTVKLSTDVMEKQNSVPDNMNIMK